MRWAGGIAEAAQCALRGCSIMEGYCFFFVERVPAASYLLIHCAVVTLRIFTVLGAKNLRRRAKLRPRRLMLGGWVPCS